MKRRLKEMDEEADALREMQAKVEKEMGSVQGFSFLSLIFRFLRIFLVECASFLSPFCTIFFLLLG